MSTAEIFDVEVGTFVSGEAGLSGHGFNEEGTCFQGAGLTAAEPVIRFKILGLRFWVFKRNKKILILNSFWGKTQHDDEK